MNRFFIRYPGFLKKALSLSYDDGVIQDIRLIEILNRYGMRCTFNLNSGRFNGAYGFSGNHSIDLKTAEKLYLPKGHEVAIHSYTHPFLDSLPAGVDAWEIVRDREYLEEHFGGIVCGMAYPMGACSKSVEATLKQCGVAYARTSSVSGTFDLPTNWFHWQATCRNTEPDLEAVCNRFLDLSPQWGPKLFLMWGHSYEFDEPGGWRMIESFCKKMGGKQDIWYATNMQIYTYLHACEQLQSSVNGRHLYNPTAVTLYLEIEKTKEHVCVRPGESLDVE